MTPRFIASDRLGAFLAAALAERQVYGMLPGEDGFRLGRIAAESAAVPPCRPIEPLKPLFFRTRQDLGRYFEEHEPPAPPPRAIIGAAACDLAALGLLDWVFLEGQFVDPRYKALRDNTLIVSADCTAPRDVCFCTFLDRCPYPQQGFDLNLSPRQAGCVIESGSECGKALLEQQGSSLPPASAEQLGERARRRESVAAQVAACGLRDARRIQQQVRDGDEHPLWEKLADKCVECAACNFVCPSCHCFLLLDLQEARGFRRFMNWDACLYPAFAREASGANPRPRRALRLHGRLQKKFDFIKANTGAWGCVGCGRCIEACAGKIDLRETLRELANA